MKIEIIARVIFVAPEVSNNKLVVRKTDDGDIRIKYEVYGPQGNVRNSYSEKFPAELLVPGTMYALVEFWDGYTLIEHRPGTYDGIYGAHSSSHKATFVVAGSKLIVFTNTPVEDGNNVTFIGGETKFWSVVKEADAKFIGFEEKARTKSEIAALLDPHASIAALEAQVDMLTRLVLSTFGTGSPEINALRDAVGDVNLTTMKTDADLLADIRTRKALVREMQAKRASKLAKAEADQAEVEIAQAQAADAQAELDAALAAKAAADARVAAAEAQAEAFRQIAKEAARAL